MAHNNEFNDHRKEALLFGVSSDMYRLELGSSLDTAANNLMSSCYTSSTLLLSSDEESTDPSSFTAEQAGKWFFVAYVVVSFVAGFKELGSRFQTWLQNREK